MRQIRGDPEMVNIVEGENFPLASRCGLSERIIYIVRHFFYKKNRINPAGSGNKMTIDWCLIVGRRTLNIFKSQKGPFQMGS